jgi:L-seryl-tRNA(Ser) seleniumtransferase
MVLGMSDALPAAPTDLFARFGIRHVINASGTETVHGASRADPAVAAAVAAILPEWIEMVELQRAASVTIAAATGAEAGFVTGCSAAGIAITVAATMTGTNLAKVEALPDTTGMKDIVVLMKGHEVNYGASVSQMIRMTGARVREIGTATACSGFQLEAALDGPVACAMYILSHHTVQSGLLPLQRFSAIAREKGVPVMVDAAAEYDWSGMLAAGATAIIVSAQKAPAGTTAGIIAGPRDFIRACMAQERGIGRPMKAGKESVAGAIAALDLWASTDHAARASAEAARLDRAAGLLSGLHGLRLEREADPAGNPFSRLMLHLDPAVAGVSAYRLGQALAEGKPKIVLRSLHADRGYLLLDVRRITDAELDHVIARIKAILAEEPGRENATAEFVPGGDLAQRAIERWLG